MELSTTEGKIPNALYHIISNVELNARRSGQMYHETLQLALFSESQPAAAGGWQMDH